MKEKIKNFLIDYKKAINWPFVIAFTLMLNALILLGEYDTSAMSMLGAFLFTNTTMLVLPLLVYLRIRNRKNIKI